MLTDIATAQSLSGTGGKLTQIDLILPEEFDPASFPPALPPGTLLVTSELRNSQVTEMTAAFQVNLTALSLLALRGGSLPDLQRHDLFRRPATLALRHFAKHWLYA